ncbi:MAG: DUF4135 domain-containing protein [Candidatus Algichlamydia australiensis]|nr:DUF4135 domain-containing protein [Chlamydiales bacterium]
MSEPIRPESSAPFSANQTSVAHFHEAVERASIPENLSEAFFQEVQQNLKKDYEEIKASFLSSKSLEPIDRIEVSIAGDECHYNGKIALFITFFDPSNKSTKVVYKPRSVLPEIYLEEFLQEINEKKARPILDSGDHGYDSFIEGSFICEDNRRLELELSSLLISPEAKQENINLIATLAGAPFEDIHNENLIIDNEGCLHFIDAEVFCTGSSRNIVTFKETAQAKIDESKKDFFQKNLKKLIEKLQSVPARLVFCGTGTYKEMVLISDEDWSNFAFFSKKFNIGSLSFEMPDNIYDYHTLFFAKYLYNKGLIVLDKDDVAQQNNIVKKIDDLFEEEGAVSCINQELAISKNSSTNEEHRVEVPIFHIHLTENWIELPSTKVRLNLKEAKCTPPNL